MIRPFTTRILVPKA